MSKKKDPTDLYEFTGKQACAICDGKGTRVVWNGSIHDPRDPETITCDHCNGTGQVIVVDNPH